MVKKRGTKKDTKQLGTNKYHFGKVLAAARRKRGLTQVELAEKLNTSSRVISYYEREAKNPSWETITKIATILDINPSTLLNPAKETAESPTLVDRSLSKKCELAQKLPVEAREQLKKFIETLIKANGIK